MIELQLINRSSVPMPRKFLQLLVQDIHRQLSKRKIKIGKQVLLTVVFLNSSPAKKLNLQYRGKNYATDVLSFVGGGPSELGELVICPQVIKKQALEHGLSYREECGYMLLHGILHLLGYDHEQSKKQAKIMFSLQDEIFEQLFN